MNRNEKQLVINSIKNDFANSEAAFLVGVKGLTVDAVQALRKGLFAQGGSIKVTKNTLLKLAVKDVDGLSELAPHFKEQIAVVFAEENSPAVAKMLNETAKQNELFQIIAGSLNNAVLDKSQVIALASLPSREILLAQVLGTLNAPITGFASVLNQLILRLLWVLKKIEEQKQN